MFNFWITVISEEPSQDWQKNGGRKLWMWEQNYTMEGGCGSLSTSTQFSSTSWQDLLVTLPNVKDLIKISSASDDSVYFVWMSWSIWLSGEKSNNKPITRNLNRGYTSSSSSSTFQYIIDCELCSLQLHTKPYPPTVSFEVISTFHSCTTMLTQLRHLTWWPAIKHCRILMTSTAVYKMPAVVHL